MGNIWHHDYSLMMGGGFLVYCTKCGTENEEDDSFCKNCGNKLKKENISRLKIYDNELKNEDKILTKGFKKSDNILRRGLKKINIRAFIIGIVSWVILIIIFGLLNLIGPATTVSSSTDVLGFIMAQLISSAIAGYIGNTNYKNGIVNGGVLCIIPTILIGFTSGIEIMVIAFFFFLCFGVLGGIIGLIFKTRLI